jgi:K+-sensing histidine kinase KdpD
MPLTTFTMPHPSDRPATGMTFGPDRLAQLVEGLPVGVFILDGAGTAIYANGAAQALLGRGVAEGDHAGNLGERFAAVRAGTDEPYPTVGMPIVRALAGERTSVDDIEVLRDGERIALEVTATPVRGNDGRVEFAVAVFQDITVRRQAQRALAALNSELEQLVGRRTTELANTIVLLEKEIAQRTLYENDLIEARASAERASRAKSIFLMNVSHELRTPLNHVIGFSDLLSDKLEEPRHKKLAETAGASGRELLEKVDHLIELARADAAPAASLVSEFDCDALLWEAAAPFGVRWDKNPPLGIHRGPAVGVLQVLHDLLQRSTALAPPEECTFSARAESNAGVTRLVVRIRGSVLAARVRTVAQLFGEHAEPDASRFRQQEIDFHLAVVRARARVMGGDLKTCGENAVEMTLPLD